MENRNNLIKIIKQKIDLHLNAIGKNDAGFSIFGIEESEAYDIYITTSNVRNFYFLHYDKNEFYNLFGDFAKVSELEKHIYNTETLINNKCFNILKYNIFFIKESEPMYTSIYNIDSSADINVILENAYQNIEFSNFSEALEKYDKIISMEPYKSEHYKARANCYMKLKMFDKSIEDICRNAIANPVSCQNIFTFTYEDLAGVYKIMGDYKNAIKYYSIILGNDPKWWVFQLRAECYKNIGKYDLAIFDIEKILEKERKIDLLLEYAKIQIQIGKTKNAFDTLYEIIEFKVKQNDEWIMKMAENRNRPVKEDAKNLLLSLKNERYSDQ